MTTKKRSYALTGVLAAAALTGQAALAQEAAPSPASADAPQAADSAATQALERVVVTARRRQENLQDVPLSVTNFSADALAARHIDDRTDLANFTPSLISITGGYPKEFAFFALRGQGPSFGSAPGVLNYFAEVANAVGIDGRVGSYLDLANVQVLAGPQGTLFGKNATGGNILFEPQRPTNKFGGYVQAEIGNLNDRRAEFALNVPIVSDTVLFRIAAERGTRDGATKDVGPNFAGKDYDNLNYTSMRASLIVRPMAGAELYTVLRYYHSDNNGPGTVLSQFNPDTGVPMAPALLIFPGLATAVAEQQARGPRRVSYDLDEFSKTRYWQAINHATFELSDTLKLKNIISYSEFTTRYAYDYDATAFPLAGQTSRTGLPTQAPTFFTEELQLQGEAFDDALNFTTGLYYDRQRLSQSQGGDFTQFPLSVAIGSFPVRANNTSESKAAFAQGTLNLGRFGMPKGLSLTAGYRYTQESVGNETQIYVLPVVAGNGSFHYSSYNLSLDYKVSNDLHVYGTTRDAYKAGGVNGSVPVDSAFYVYKPEQLKDVELGVKSQFLIGDVAARANLAVYRGDYRNIQRTANGTAQVAGTIAEVSHGANQTGAASRQLLSSAKQLSESTTSLQAEIDGFLKSIAAAA